MTKFDELKLKKQLKYVVYKLNDNKTEIVVENDSSDDQEATYDSFLERLPEKDCRWAVYDFDYHNAEGAPRNKIVLFAWSPEGSPIKSKMVYSSSKDALRRALSGVGVEVQGTDFDDVSHESVLDKCLKGR
ncbi:actin depolymerization factor/cofilin-like domain-containing protein [Streptomyces sp. NPDC051211]|uniref:actin-binding ADF family protein n=1 Tax=Streptomyces sp. NPDC051211 TaxID=3154643 RepID=UPI00344B08CC